MPINDKNSEMSLGDDCLIKKTQIEPASNSQVLKGVRKKFASGFVALWFKIMIYHAGLDLHRELKVLSFGFS